MFQWPFLQLVAGKLSQGPNYLPTFTCKFLTFRTHLQKLRGFPRTRNHQPSHPIPSHTARHGPHSRRLGCAPNKWMKSAQSWAHSPGLVFFSPWRVVGKNPTNLDIFVCVRIRVFFCNFSSLFKHIHYHL